ncbi:hypothetical protein [Roseibium marinum]|uniref:Uncharacterized protein n=1 Tax=Roseibium marinum TaxID=281252 RepID=A0A2S3UJY5_9HYPH|nr:hypothetical protein [Roseibium marinum]POF28042.1 hypothetical protein CLV41_11846 [Roseibium marinum]
MHISRGFLTVALAGLACIGSLAIAPPEPARAELFYCKSTRTPQGNEPYCNFLLFDKSFTRHKQVIVAQGAVRDVDINGNYDVFCVLVQGHTGTPDQFDYRRQQCRQSDTGRNYQFPIKALNMRQGRNGFSSDAVQNLLPAQRW